MRLKVHRYSKPVNILELNMLTIDDIVYKTYGDEAGYPVFYLHGWISSSVEAELLHLEACDKQVYIISIDRMQSRNGKGLNYQQVSHAIDLLSSLFNYSECGVIGCSGGAPFALIAGEQCSSVTKVVVLAGTAIIHGSSIPKSLLPANYQAFFALRYVPYLFYLSLIFLKRSASRNIEKIFINHGLPAEDLKVFEDSHFKNVVAKAFKNALRSGIGAAYREGRFMISDWGKLINNLSKPVRWYHGKKDINVPLDMVKKTIDSLTTKGDIEFCAIDNAGHASLSEKKYSDALAYMIKH